MSSNVFRYATPTINCTMSWALNLLVSRVATCKKLSLTEHGHGEASDASMDIIFFLGVSVVTSLLHESFIQLC
jgi:hypothetical protein